MTHTRLFALSLFLVFPAATQCMEKEIVVKPKTMQNIGDERDTLKKTLDDNKFFWWWGATDCPDNFFLDCTYRQALHKETYRKHASHIEPLQYVLDEKWFLHYNIDKISQQSVDQIDILKTIRSYDTLYSCLGSATMAENVSFQEIKEFIQKLLHLNFTPTQNDRDLALLRKYKEFGPVIIKKIFLLPDILPSLEAEARHEFIKNISVLMFNLEESLL